MDNLLKKPILLASFALNGILLLGIIGVLIYSSGSNLQQKYELERKQKIQISNIWNDQAAQNDDLISTQQTMMDKTRGYLQLIKNSVRFVNGQPLFYENVTQAEFDKQRREVEDSLSKIAEIQKKNATQKAFSKDTIERLFLESNSVPDNRFNETGGVK